MNDPAIKHLNPKIGDVVRIRRKSVTAGETEYYRVVVKG
jgi:DNA-directed RNA polymerase subunit H (RpoH/RPB5)